jgi:hypothetical protein
VGVSELPSFVHVAVDELVLDGVAPDDPLVTAAIERSVGPALAEHGLGGEAVPVAGAVAGALGQELAR